MSEFCGKCDFYDSIVMINLDGDRSAIEEYLKETNIYIRGKDGREHKVDCKTEKDLAKYYPYLVGIGAFGKEKRTVVLSSKCFIDSEEEEFLNFHIQDAYFLQCNLFLILRLLIPIFLWHFFVFAQIHFSFLRL